MKANKSDEISPAIASKYFNRMKLNSSDFMIIEDELADGKENSQNVKIKLMPVTEPVLLLYNMLFLKSFTYKESNEKNIIRPTCCFYFSSL